MSNEELEFLIRQVYSGYLWPKGFEDFKTVMENYGIDPNGKMAKEAKKIWNLLEKEERNV